MTYVPLKISCKVPLRSFASASFFVFKQIKEILVRLSKCPLKKSISCPLWFFQEVTSNFHQLSCLTFLAYTYSLRQFYELDFASWVNSSVLGRIDFLSDFLKISNFEQFKACPRICFTRVTIFHIVLQYNFTYFFCFFQKKLKPFPFYLKFWEGDMELITIFFYLFSYSGPQDDHSINLAFSKKEIESRKEWLTNHMDEGKRRNGEKRCFRLRISKVLNNYCVFSNNMLFCTTNEFCLISLVNLISLWNE